MSPRTVPSFTSFTQSLPASLPSSSLVTAYRVERVNPVRGAPSSFVEPLGPLWRVELAGQLPIPDAPFIGSTGHLVYTDAATRAELVRISAAEKAAHAVLIPICKSSEWWALSQDARQAYLDGSRATGHVAIGRNHAARIYRRLYHARYLPGSLWDFLTYFEFDGSDVGRFEELLAALRDPAQNPEWTFVDRETEIWLTRTSPRQI